LIFKPPSSSAIALMCIEVLVISGRTLRGSLAAAAAAAAARAVAMPLVPADVTDAARLACLVCARPVASTNPPL